MARRASESEGAAEGLEGVIAEQARYYRERAGEYEDWWYRRGRYDRGEDANARWFSEVRELRTQVRRHVPDAGGVLELACGTGLWTELLAETAASVTALDAAPQMLEVVSAKLPGSNVSFLEADVFAWEPGEAYELCFFGFWLSHVPLRLMPPFWAKVARSLTPGGRVYFVDSARSELASARDHELGEPGEELTVRRLDDGREYHIVKHWFEARALEELLRSLGWNASVACTGEFFVHGSASPAH